MENWEASQHHTGPSWTACSSPSPRKSNAGAQTLLPKNQCPPRWPPSSKHYWAHRQKNAIRHPRPAAPGRHRPQRPDPGGCCKPTAPTSRRKKKKTGTAEPPPNPAQSVRPAAPRDPPAVPGRGCCAHGPTAPRHRPGCQWRISTVNRPLAARSHMGGVPALPQGHGVAQRHAVVGRWRQLHPPDTFSTASPCPGLTIRPKP